MAEAPAPYIDWFPPSVTSRQGDALLRLLRDDPSLAAYCAGRIRPWELRELQQSHDLIAPSIGLILERTDDSRHYPGEAADHVVTWTIAYVDRGEDTGTTRGWLRARVVDHVYGIVNRTKGRLLDLDGSPLSESIVGWAAAVHTGLISASGHLIVPMELRLTSFINRHTREFVP